MAEQKMKKSSICIAVFSLLLVACNALSGEKDENPVGRENSDAGKVTKSSETKAEWPEEHDNCKMQELSECLYEHTSVSPYAGAEITVRDYEGEITENEWDEPMAFRFAGEADVVWQYYNSLEEMETALKEKALQEVDGN